MTQIAFYIAYKDWLGNRMFDASAPCNRNDVARRWIALRQAMAARGMSLNTYDTYDKQSDIDYWLMMDPWKTTLEHVWYHRINPRRAMLMLHEPPVINPWGWKNLKYYGWMFRGFLTWHTGFCAQSKRFQPYHFPCWFEQAAYATYRSTPKRNLALMIHANKTSTEPGELYSLRREVIRYFEKRGDTLLDLYGYDWNNPDAADPFFSDLYQGTTDDKRETYSRYYYSFCIDNSVVPGYVTYDPLISMATGTVPVYKPMPDSMRLIPEDTFINLDAFSSYDALTEHLQDLIASGEYEAYRDRGWAFLNSSAYAPFTTERFCEEMCDGIEHFIGRQRTRKAAA